MNGPVVVDAGPLIALLNRREGHHAWVAEQFRHIRPPAITCEAVLSEAVFLLRNIHDGVDSLMQLLARNAVTIAFTLADEASAVTQLLSRYSSVPISLADACLVRPFRSNSPTAKCSRLIGTFKSIVKAAGW